VLPASKVGCTEDERLTKTEVVMLQMESVGFAGQYTGAMAM
jgi:hypothetical protein